MFATRRYFLTAKRSRTYYRLFARTQPRLMSRFRDRKLKWSVTKESSRLSISNISFRIFNFSCPEEITLFFQNIDKWNRKVQFLN